MNKNRLHPIESDFKQTKFILKIVERRTKNFYRTILFRHHNTPPTPFCNLLYSF